MDDHLGFTGMQEQQCTRDLSNNAGTDFPWQPMAVASAEKAAVKALTWQIFVDETQRFWACSNQCQKMRVPGLAKDINLRQKTEISIFS
jgi:hypothetical protein